MQTSKICSSGKQGDLYFDKSREFWMGFTALFFHSIYRHGLLFKTIIKMKEDKIDYSILLEAFQTTCRKRGTVFSKDEVEYTLAKIKTNEPLAQMWEQFRKKNFFVGDL